MVRAHQAAIRFMVHLIKRAKFVQQGMAVFKIMFEVTKANPNEKMKR